MTPISNLKKAIALYQGDLLPGHYEDWVLAVRERLRVRYLACLDQLVLHLENERQYQEAIRYAQLILSEDPLHETTYRRLMRLQALDSNVAAALRIYHTCSTILQQELGVAPSRATQESYERLLNIEAPSEAPLPARATLVGREPVWVTLQSLWRKAVKGQIQVTLLTGEAGIGKTRMAEELLDWAKRQGITVLTAVCYAAEGQLPYAPIADWLRADEMKSVFHQTDDKWLVECARLLPEILSLHAGLEPPGPLIEGWQRQHFFIALAQVILSTRQPLLLFIDDLQWGDQDTLDWLHFLLRFDKQACFMLLCTARTEEITPNHPLIPWQQFVQRDSNLTAIQLNRLDAEATNQLAAGITQWSLDQEQAARLYAETEGNPLFIVEIARAGFQNAGISTSPSDINLPPKVQAVIETRLSHLSPLAQELINLAAVIGRSFTFDLLTEASGEDTDMVVRALDELWQRRIVREQGLDAYDFSHDKIRRVVYAGLSAARRRMLHGRIINALKTLHTDNLDKVSGQLAVHYEAARQLPAAVGYYLRAAQVSNHIFAHQETERHLRRAIALFSRTDVSASQQTEAYELLGDVLELTGKHEEAQEVLEIAISHTQDPIRQSELYRKIARSWQQRRTFKMAFQNFQMAEAALGSPGKTVTNAWWQEWLWVQVDQFWLLYWSVQIEALAELTRRIRPIIDQYGLPIQRGLYFQGLVLFALWRDRFLLTQETVGNAQTAVEIIAESGCRDQIAFARFIQGLAHFHCGWRGHLDEAETIFQVALSDAEAIGDVALQSWCLISLAKIYRRQQDIEKVRDYVSRTVLVAKKANMMNFLFFAQAQTTWIAWREGNLAQTKQQAQEVIDYFQQTRRGPYWGDALWPLLGVNIAQGDTETAVKHARLLLDPSEMRMPENVITALQQAVTAWEANQPQTACTALKRSLQLAQEMNYL